MVAKEGSQKKCTLPQTPGDMKTYHIIPYMHVAQKGTLPVHAMYCFEHPKSPPMDYTVIIRFNASIICNLLTPTPYSNPYNASIQELFPYQNHLP